MSNLPNRPSRPATKQPADKPTIQPPTNQFIVREVDGSAFTGNS